MKAYIRFQDVGGIQSSAWFKNMVNSATLAAVQTFAATIKFATNAGIKEYGVIRSYGFDISDGTPDAESNVKNKARLHFNSVNENGETGLVSIWIPAPDMAMFENVEGVGYRVLQASGEAIRDALRTMTGITNLAYSTGILDYSESAKGNKSENCIEFLDVSGNKCWMNTPQPIIQAALSTFATFITGYSIAAAQRGNYVTTEATVLLSTDPLAIPNADINGLDSVERRCAVKFVYVEGTHRKFMTMNLPAPASANLIQGKDKKGYSLAVGTGNTMAVNLTAMYGIANRSLTFKNGKVAHSELDPQ